MFKKTLMCTALLAVSGGALAKATGAATEIVHSTEGALGVISQATADTRFTLGASYTQGDTVTLTWSQALAAGVGHTALYIRAITTPYVAAAAANNGPDNIANNADDVAEVIEVIEVLTNNAGSIPLTVLDSTSTSVTYRAGAVPAGYDYTKGQTLLTTGKSIKGVDNANASSVTLGYAAATSTGVAIDSGTAATTVALYYDQFGVDIVKANALVDVENSRKKFSATDSAGGTGHSTTVDVISAEINTLAAYTSAIGLGTTATGLAATINDGSTSILPATSVVIAGDYSWLDKASTAAFDIDATLGSVTPFAATDTSSSITLLPTVLTTAAALTLTTTGVAVLSGKTYTAAPTLKFANSASVQKTRALPTVSAGAWGLNGATVTAYGIPNQAAVTPFLWVQNAGTSAGEITGSASCSGATIDLGSLGSAAGDTNTSVGVAVQAAVDAAGTCVVGSRYDATLTVNAKATDVTLTAGYKVQAADGSHDRLSLETSDSLN